MTAPNAPCWPKTIRLAVVVVLLFNVALLLTYIVWGFRFDFHTDASAKNLLAQEMFESGAFFPPDWNYVNGDLMVLFGQLFVVPVLAFVDNGFEAHAFAGVASATLVLASVWLVTGLLSRSAWVRWASVALSASGLSAVGADSLFGQVSYGPVLSFAAFSLYLAGRLLGAHGPIGWPDRACIVALALLTIAIYWSNPQRAVASYGLPLLGAIAFVAVTRRAPEPSRWRCMGLVAGILACAMAGTALHAWVLRTVNNTEGASSARWLDAEGIADNLGYTAQGLIAVLGGLPPAGDSVVGIGGVFAALRLVVATAAIGLICVAVVRSLKVDQPFRTRLFGAFTALSFSIVLLLQIATTLPDMRDPVTSSRYLVVPMIFGVLLLLAQVSVSAPPNNARRFGALGVVVVLALSALSPQNPLSRPLRPAAVDPRDALLASLQRAGLRYGYAGYWNAGALTVLSGQRVRVRQIKIEQGMPLPMRHLGSNRWYTPDAWQGTTFFLLNDAEYDAIDWAVMERYLGSPTRQFRDGGFRVVLYARNPAGALPGWSGDFAHPMTLLVTSLSPHAIGRLDHGGAVLVSEPEEAGALHFGPYLPMPAGRYVATFDVTCARDEPGSCGTVDVVSGMGKATHGRRSLLSTVDSQPEVDFSLDQPVKAVEFRVFSDGGGRVAFRGVTVRRIDARTR
ncbi:hypothetical protein SD81_023200 [Tolypothrix campylonemoides VB511288]|nr:hypothetical protein SD81_023200 [Tolypothrix campylonemoides VB511288]